jgi:hypothetical protein
VPLILVLLVMQHFFVPHGYRQLALHMLAGGTVYGLCMAWAYTSGKALHVTNLSTPAEQAHEVEMIASSIETLPEDV